MKINTNFESKQGRSSSTMYYAKPSFKDIKSMNKTIELEVVPICNLQFTNE